MQKQAVVFFGTHTFAATVLQGLIESPFIDVEKVITQPDRPVGRKQTPEPSPVKVLATTQDIEIEQPPSLKQFNLATSASVFIVAQYGLLIPKNILDIPKHGVINVHTSLLPKYRGASPIQSALIHGEQKTGVTIMKMDVGMDTGPMILQKTIKVGPNDTYPMMDAKLAALGTQALLEALPPYLDGSLKPMEQNEELATTCRQLTREDGKIDWHNTTKNIYNKYRGQTPWPGIWTTWNDKRVKLLSIQPSEKNLSPGVVSLDRGTLYIGTMDSAIEVLEIQIEGKKAMDIQTFSNGHASIDGATVS